MWTIQGVEHDTVGHGRQVGDGNGPVCSELTRCCGGCWCGQCKEWSMTQ